MITVLAGNSYNIDFKFWSLSAHPIEGRRRVPWSEWSKFEAKLMNNL